MQHVCAHVPWKFTSAIAASWPFAYFGVCADVQLECCRVEIRRAAVRLAGVGPSIVHGGARANRQAVRRGQQVGDCAVSVNGVADGLLGIFEDVVEVLCKRAEVL
jgi:hypothetical protein